MGVIGAILGGFASYMELQTVLNQRARHNRFEQLATSEVVQQESKNLQLWKPVIDPKTGEPIQIDPKTGERIQAAPVDYDALAAKYGATPQGKPLPPSSTGIEYDREGKPIKAAPDPYATIAIPNPSDVNEGGIKTINWTNGYGVESIVTEDGQTLYPTPAPVIQSYALIVLFPILGFLLPWGAIRGVEWVRAGFTEH